MPRNPLDPPESEDADAIDALLAADVAPAEPEPTPEALADVGVPDTSALAPMPASSPKRFSRARMNAGLLFASTDLSVAQIAKRPEFRAAGIGRTKLSRWSREDNWQSLRAKQNEAWRQKATEKLGGELVTARLKDIDTLQKVQRRAFEYLDDPEVMPRSLEGILRVGMTAIELQDKMREAVAKTIVDDKKPATSAVDELSEEALQRMAQALLEGGDATQVAEEKAAEP